MPLDTSNSPVVIPNQKELALERLQNRAIRHKRLGTDIENTYSVGDLNLDNLTKYEDYVDLEGKNVVRENINKLRAENQGNFRQFVYGTAGGVGKGALHAVAGAANLLDFEAHINQAQGINDTEPNFISELMNEGVIKIGETMPIYQEDPSKVFDASDGASYFKAWEGLVDSAVQFAAPGGLITKGIGAVMKGGKMAQWVAQLATKSKTLATLVENAPAALVMNQFEGGIMAYETAKEVKGELIAARDRGELEITDEEIEDKAQEAFSDTKMFNMALLPITALQTMGIAKGLGYTRNLLTDKSTFTNRFKNFGKSFIQPNADNFFVQGAGEAAEEIAQGVMSGEAKYQAQLGTGTETGSKNFLERVKEFGTSDQALLEGAMGFFGGGVQRVMMEGISGQYSKTAREEYNKKYSEQQAFMEKMKDFTAGKAKLNAEWIQEKEALLKEGRHIEADLIDKQILGTLAVEAFQLGTMEMVENQLKDIAEGKMLPDQAQYLGEDAQAKASEMLKEVKELEQLWLKYVNNPIGTKLFNNRVNKKNYSQSLDKTNNSILDITSTIGNDIARKIEPLLTKKAIDGKTLPYNIDEVITAAINDSKESIKTGKKVTRDVRESDFNKLVEGVKNTEELGRLIELQDIKSSLVEAVNSLDKQYGKISSGKGFSEAIKTEKLKIASNKKVLELYKTNEKEQTTQTPAKGDVILDVYGQPFTVTGFNSTTSKIGVLNSLGEKTEHDKENFFKNFLDSETNTYTKFINKDIIAERKAQAAKKNNQANATKGSSEANANTAHTTSSNAQTNETAFDEIQTNNPEIDIPTLAEVKAGQSMDTAKDKVESLAWSSFNNIDEKKNPNRPTTKEAEDISEYLENPVNLLVGTRVKLEKDVNNEFSETAIKATLLDKQGNPITHNGTVISLMVREDSKLREGLQGVLSNNEVAYTTVTEKYPGYIQFDKVSPPSKLDAALGIPVKDMEFRVQTLQRFVNGKFTGEKADYDEEIGALGINKTEEGQVVVKVKTANGKPFPLRLTVNTVSETEAEVIYQMYKLLMGDVSIVASISEHPELLALIKELPIGKFLNLKEAKFKDVFKLITNQGNELAAFPMHINNHILMYGKGEHVGSFNRDVFKDPAAEAGAKLGFITWLTKYKTKNVDWRRIDNTAYKQYLVDEVVTTKAKYNANGIIFAQPLIAVDTTVQKDSSQVTDSWEEVTEVSSDIQNIADSENATVIDLLGTSLLAQKEESKLDSDTTQLVNTTNENLEGEIDAALETLLKESNPNFRDDSNFISLRNEITITLTNDKGVNKRISLAGSNESKVKNIIEGAVEIILKSKKYC